MEKCRKCNAEEGTKRFFAYRTNFAVCEKCRKQLLTALENKEKATREYEDMTAILLGLAENK